MTISKDARKIYCIESMNNAEIGDIIYFNKETVASKVLSSKGLQEFY